MYAGAMIGSNCGKLNTPGNAVLLTRDSANVAPFAESRAFTVKRRACRR